MRKVYTQGTYTYNPYQGNLTFNPIYKLPINLQV